jgi:hypothetical protein
VLDGKVESARLDFVTRSSEMAGVGLVHHYSGRLVGDEIHLVMQTEGGTTAQGPVSFVARRAGASAAAGGWNQRGPAQVSRPRQGAGVTSLASALVTTVRAAWFPT